MNPLYCAIDTADLSRARDLARALEGEVGGVKLGLEFFCAQGPKAVSEIAEIGRAALFLDLKLHDIPNTVAHAVEAVLPLRPTLLTIHAGGGVAMMEAAAGAAARAGENAPALIAVTVLTSLDDTDLFALGIEGTAEEHTVRLAKLALRSGLDGVVCSAHEIAAVRAAVGPEAILVVPGLRAAGESQADQKRVMTPAEALALGADVLVVGRSITRAMDPAGAARDILQSLGA